jgi:hypothetical protein
VTQNRSCSLIYELVDLFVSWYGFPKVAARCRISNREGAGLKLFVSRVEHGVRPPIAGGA